MKSYKTISVNIEVSRTGKADFFFEDPESGDNVWYHINLKESSDTEDRKDRDPIIGQELISWAEIMLENMKEV